MPEIAEVTRVLHFLKKHAVGRTISSVAAEHDDIVYGKVGCSADAFKKAMTGKKILDARQQGKYFWLVMDSPPHPVMHFGMTGWLKFSNDDSSFYKPTKDEDKVWPPKFRKFVLSVKGNDGEEDREVAFVDARRLGRIRLVDCEADQIRKMSPLKENGPDPVIDKDILTQDWLKKKLRSKKVPVKALLLDQANISGVGNWVGDEVLYQARIHPEQYSNTLSDSQVKDLHTALIDVCTTACDLLADADKFPKTWLVKHRAKGKKGAGVLPNGDKIIHLTVGGRTSAVVPSVQKKTGPVAGDADEQDEQDEEDEKPAKKAKRDKEPTNGVENDSLKKRKATADAVKEEQNAPKKAKEAKEAATPTTGRRRSGRGAK
ncbi:formamidopyrimidine-DNA glycosylase [Verruconis gallopava]|uniref:Formamidopyrimidine-DNA glycosylase n=1 Tax=Verruconis gallopava TaxID=253628 RepID=A0A0D1ZXU9_9PEZI|nr:formamidopyrimidine-DNA glycosylase [Verruconis gallopava]KIV98904.1 formamidopyrimidine-DNA glycosylase [Verruconis gallopava]